MQPCSDQAKLTFPQLSPVIITRQLYRLLNSTALARASFLTRLLKYCVEQTLAGNSGQLKEMWLGAAVFDRNEKFDPRRDPIVRVQARRLRQKLAAYYQTESLVGEVRITFPVGSYVPIFSTVDAKRWTAAPKGRQCSIAVLPLSTLDDDPDSDRFAGVVTAELTQALAEAGGLEVVSRTSSLAFKDVAADVRSIGKKLNADFIVEGSVRLDENRHRICLQLTGCDTGYHCWAAWFEQRNTRVTPDARRIAALLRQELAASGFNHAQMAASARAS